MFKFQPCHPCCTSPVCSVGVSIFSPSPCSADAGGQYGQWNFYGIAAAANAHLSAAITGPTGVVVATLPAAGGLLTTSIPAAASGPYHVVISEVGSIGVGGFFGFAPGATAFSGTSVALPAPTIYFGGGPIARDFTVTCPGSSRFSLAGPAMTRFSMLVGFPAPTFPPPVPAMSPFSATITTNAGQTTGFAMRTVVDPTTFTPSYSYDVATVPDSRFVGGLVPTLLLESDGADLTISGTARYQATFDGVEYVVNASFSLNFCDGPSQIINHR